MLRELRIENLLLIERAELRLEPGLNVITGETGAGKTVLAHSLDLLLGGRPRGGIVRPGASEAWVEGSFAFPAGLRAQPDLAELTERLPADEDEVVLARRVSAAGRSAAFIAGRAASAADLRSLGGQLLAFYGQHEHRRLTLASAQGEILDGFAGPEHLAARERYRAAHARFAALRRERDALEQRSGARDRELDLLRFELAEIEEVGPDTTEHAELVATRDRLRGVEGLREGAGRALAAVSGDGEEAGAAACLAAAEGDLARVSGVDSGLDRIGSRLAALAIDLADVGGELRSYLESLEADPERLDAVESRLDALGRLLRKHDGSVEAVLEHADRCRREIDRLEHADEQTAELEVELAAAAQERAALGAELTAARVEAGPRLERAVAAELAELAMDGARVEVALHEHPDGYGPLGRETVELRVATNPGMPAAPLRDAASGGELSRVMLALAGLGGVAGERPQEVSTLAFDEVDAGVGGKVARRVGERLRALGRGRQVICITHLPQVASRAAAHFRVEKSSSPEATTASVERVDGEDLVAEIVRMLGAEGGDEAADRHARELLAA